MRICVLLLALSSIARAAEICPWLNAATAGGVLGGAVTDVTVKLTEGSADGSCEFVRHDSPRAAVLRIEVETLRDPAKDFAAFAARCHAAGTPLKAIGNEAIACTDESAQIVVGRVRDRAFVLRITTGGREKARQIAEQVAGILF
jgi:hypothetical protein